MLLVHPIESLAPHCTTVCNSTWFQLDIVFPSLHSPHWPQVCTVYPLNDDAISILQTECETWFRHIRRQQNNTQRTTVYRHAFPTILNCAWIFFADFYQCLNIFRSAGNFRRSLHGASWTIYKKNSKIFKFCFVLKVLISISRIDAKKLFLY
jgi:hypothetical protein